jgi:hypothetical protein
MARYLVILDFTEEDSFSIEITADGRTWARRLAEQAARDCGWTSAVVTALVKPLYREDRST